MTINEWIKKNLGDIPIHHFGENSICTTCKFFDGKYCKKGFSHVGFATKLKDCNDEWEACNG